MARFISTHAFTFKKTASYYLTHMAVAIGVGYAVTGDWLIAMTFSLVEPAVQAVAYFFHERAWSRQAQRHTSSNASVIAAGSGAH
jgi:uncharacterized membrane protein